MFKSMFIHPSIELKRQVNEAVDADVLFEGTDEGSRAEELTKLLMVAGVDVGSAETMEKVRGVIESFCGDGPESPRKARNRKSTVRKHHISLMHIKEKSIKE